MDALALIPQCNLMCTSNVSSSSIGGSSFDMLRTTCKDIQPYCFSRSSVTFQAHTGQKIVNFHPNFGFPDCNTSLNWPMAIKWCTKLEVAKKRGPTVFQGHQSNFKVTQGKTLLIFTQIWCFQTVTPVWMNSFYRCGHSYLLVANQQGSYDNCARCYIFFNIKRNIF